MGKPDATCRPWMLGCISLLLMSVPLAAADARAGLQPHHEVNAAASAAPVVVPVVVADALAIARTPDAAQSPAARPFVRLAQSIAGQQRSSASEENEQQPQDGQDGGQDSGYGVDSATGDRPAFGGCKGTQIFAPSHFPSPGSRPCP